MNIPTASEVRKLINKRDMVQETVISTTLTMVQRVIDSKDGEEWFPVDNFTPPMRERIKKELDKAGYKTELLMTPTGTILKVRA